MRDHRRLLHTLDGLVEDGALTGAAAAVLDREGTATITVGFADLRRTVPLCPDVRFRLASVSKPVTAALALALVQDGLLALEDPIARWVPELASPVVLRGDAGDVVPAARPVLVRHLLESTCGWGFPGDLSRPGVDAMLAAVGDGRHRHLLPGPDAWLAGLARVPLLFGPGERWLYDTAYDLLGVVLARAAARPLPALMAERLLDPLGMRATGFAIDPGAPLAEGVRWEDGRLRGAGHAGVTALPRFASGAGGLIGTLEDLVRFARMLLDDGPVLSRASVEAMTSDRLTAEQRSEGGFFLDGQSWGYGGTVDVAPAQPWHAPGRYGWVGVTGTSLHVRRDRGSALVLLTARELVTDADSEVMHAIWMAAADAE